MHATEYIDALHEWLRDLPAEPTLAGAAAVASVLEQFYARLLELFPSHPDAYSWSHAMSYHSGGYMAYRMAATLVVR